MHDAYRFVVVYRSEIQSSGDPETRWRGWIEQVYPPSEQAGRRRWFLDVKEIPGLITEAIPQIRPLA